MRVAKTRPLQARLSSVCMQVRSRLFFERVCPWHLLAHAGSRRNAGKFDGSAEALLFRRRQLKVEDANVSAASSGRAATTEGGASDGRWKRAAPGEKAHERRSTREGQGSRKKRAHETRAGRAEPREGGGGEERNGDGPRRLLAYQGRKGMRRWTGKVLGFFGDISTGRTRRDAHWLAAATGVRPPPATSSSSSTPLGQASVPWLSGYPQRETASRHSDAEPTTCRRPDPCLFPLPSFFSMLRAACPRCPPRASRTPSPSSPQATEASSPFVLPPLTRKSDAFSHHVTRAMAVPPGHARRQGALSVDERAIAVPRFSSVSADCLWLSRRP